MHVSQKGVKEESGSLAVLYTTQCSWVNTIEGFGLYAISLPLVAETGN